MAPSMQFGVGPTSWLREGSCGWEGILGYDFFSLVGLHVSFILVFNLSMFVVIQKTLSFAYKIQQFQLSCAKDVII